MIIYTTKEYPFLDLRVDDHAEALMELRRLYDESQQMFIPFAKFLPKRDDPSGVYDRAVIDAEVARVQATLRG